MTNINREELRKEVIGPFNSLEQKLEIYDRLVELGESMFNSREFYKTKGGGFRWAAGVWFNEIIAGVSIPPQDFLAKYMVEGKPNYILNPEVAGEPKALKFDQGKAPLHHLRPEHVEGACRVFEWAEKTKYPRQENGDPNFLLGHSKRQLMAGVLRHLLADQSGELLDPESGLPHLHHALCGIMMHLSQLKAGTVKDDD